MKEEIDVFSVSRPKPTGEDYLRALAYFGVIVWTVLFLIFPPVAYIDSLDTITRIVWVGACSLGAVAALLGSLLRIDLKLELPGLCFMLIGPLFYSFAQVYYTLFPPATQADPTARIALTAYAILPLLMSLPRVYSLYNESQKASAIRKEMAQAMTISTKGEPQ
jgi:hypothetical protein